MVGTAFSSKKVNEQIEKWKKEKTYKQEIDYNIEKLRTVNGYNSILTNSTNEETIETTLLLQLTFKDKLVLRL